MYKLLRVPEQDILNRSSHPIRQAILVFCCYCFEAVNGNEPKGYSLISNRKCQWLFSMPDKLPCPVKVDIFL